MESHNSQRRVPERQLGPAGPAAPPPLARHKPPTMYEVNCTYMREAWTAGRVHTASPSGVECRMFHQLQTGYAVPFSAGTRYSDCRYICTLNKG